jgi:hypothetical protein
MYLVLPSFPLSWLKRYLYTLSGTQFCPSGALGDCFSVTSVSGTLLPIGIGAAISFISIRCCCVCYLLLKKSPWPIKNPLMMLGHPFPLLQVDRMLITLVSAIRTSIIVATTPAIKPVEKFDFETSR